MIFIALTISISDVATLIPATLATPFPTDFFRSIGGMFKHFVAAREDEPSDAWRARFAVGRDETVPWYLYAQIRRGITAHISS